MTEPLTLLFYRGSGIGAWLERVGCRFPCQALREVPGHVAVRVGGDVYEAVASGVHWLSYGDALRRAGLLREIALPERSDAQIAAARAYASSCRGEAYGWDDIALIIWAWAAPGVVASFSKRFREGISTRRATICSLFAMLTLAAAGCRLHECVAPAATPNELMMRAEDYAAAEAETGDKSTALCG